MKRECSTPSKHSRICAELFTEDCLKHNVTVRTLLGLFFKPHRLASKKDAVPTIFYFRMESCKPAIGQTNNEKQANNALPKTGEFLGHFTSKGRFVFRSKTFPTKDSLTPKRRNVQDKNDVTKQSQFHSFH